MKTKNILGRVIKREKAKDGGKGEKKANIKKNGRKTEKRYKRKKKK